MYCAGAWGFEDKRVWFCAHAKPAQGYVDDIQILEDEMQAYMVEGNMLYEDGHKGLG